MNVLDGQGDLFADPPAAPAGFPVTRAAVAGMARTSTQLAAGSRAPLPHLHPATVNALPADTRFRVVATVPGGGETHHIIRLAVDLPDRTVYACLIAEHGPLLRATHGKPD